MFDSSINQTSFFHQESKNASNYAIITIFDGSSEPIEINLADFNKSVISFGRDERNDVRIRSKFASRQHGYFKMINGEWIIENNPRSTNGILFSGQRIEHRILDDGDNIRIDNNMESSAVGVLIVFSKGSETGWQSFAVEDNHEVTIGRSED